MLVVSGGDLLFDYIYVLDASSSGRMINQEMKIVNS